MDKQTIISMVKEFEVKNELQPRMSSMLEREYVTDIEQLQALTSMQKDFSTRINQLKFEFIILSRLIREYINNPTKGGNNAL